MNRKIRKALTRTVSLLIVMVMIAGVFPLSVLADGLDGNETRTEAGYSEDEDQSDISYDEEPPVENDEKDIADDIDTCDGDSDEEVIDVEEGPVGEEPAAAPENGGSTLNRLSISRDDTDFPSGKSYVMEKTEGQEFLVNYRYSNLENVVLVVDCLDLGADFAAIPEKNEFFNEAILLSQGKMALRLTNAADRTDCTIGFRMKHVKLTDEQAKRIMDSDSIPTARIAATEYTLPIDADLADVLTLGTKGEECILWEGTPYYNPDSSITVTSSSAGYTHTFKLTVSPVGNESGSYTNFFFDYVNTHRQTKIFNGYKNGSPRFVLPGAYNDGGSLMEILSIRIYEPTDLVRLKELSAPGAGYSDTGDLMNKAYDGSWGDWTVGERTFDPDKNAYYYDLTPATRAFNTETKGLIEYLCGMTLRWTMNDLGKPLDPESSYLAENTVITFRLPGDGKATRTAEFRGPEILTGKIEYTDIQTVFNTNYSAPGATVNVGSKYSTVNFTSISNGIYVTADSTQFPIYDKSIIQEYDFPYQIAPSKIYFGLEKDQLVSASEHPVLEGISYTTWDSDTWTDVDQSEIDKLNIAFSKVRDASTGSVAFPTDSQVRKVQVKWSRLSTWTKVDTKPELKTYFDFIPNHCTDKTCSDHLAQGVQVQVKYREYYDSSYRNGEYRPEEVQVRMLLPGQTAASRQTVEDYFWFKLVCKACEPKKCPALIGNGEDNTINFFNSGVNANVGDVGFDRGDYDKGYDYIHNPEITLKLLNAGTPTVDGTFKFENITDDQMIAFFTGEFTAMPKLSGWTFNYTAENKEHDVYTNSVTIPEITDEEGVTDHWLPLPEGYAFTSVKLSYDGEFDLSHVDENDTEARVWLMKGLVVHRNPDIPFLDKKVEIPYDSQIGVIKIGGSVTFDITELADGNGPHCACGKHISGQTMTYTVADKLVKRVRIIQNRGTSVNITTKTPQNAVIYQGEGVGDTSSEDASVIWDDKGGVNFGGASFFDTKETGYVSYYPYEDINEAVYIELTDEEFVPDLENSMLWGYPLTDSCIHSDIVIVYDASNKPHRFLKLQFVEGFIRTKFYRGIPRTTRSRWEDDEFKELDPNDINNGIYYGAITIDGHVFRRGTVTGSFRLAFKTVAGTTIGEHHPVGMIYYDFSDLLKNYNASLKIPKEQWTGYDYNRTYYSIYTNSNNTKDSLGLTGDKTNTLFYQDGSSWTVNVLLHQETGVSLVPGKNQTYYDYDDHVIDFYPGEEKELNALMTLTGPGEPTASSIYDVTSIAVLPRTGKTIEYTESEISQGTQTDYEKVSAASTMDLYLCGVPDVIGNSTDNSPVFSYTTSDDPLSAGATWVDADAVSDWRSVTGIKVTMSSMAPKTSVNIRLDLETDAKTSFDALTAFAGGSFKYRLTQNGSFIEPQHLELSNWLYNSYEINGFVFWDVYDEDGVVSSNVETGINNVPVTLYDAEGKAIAQTRGTHCINPETGTYYTDGSVRTDKDGKFTLYSNNSAKDQYIVIGLPETSDGSIPAFTSVSSNPYMLSSEDSDFDRTTGKLVLNQLDTRAGYNNVSAGFIKLPTIKATEIVMYTGETATKDALIDEFVSNINYDDNNILTNGTYKIEFSEIDESIATLGDYGKMNPTSDLTMSSAYSFTGVAPGSFTAKATLTNRVGDSVSAPFKVTVLARPQEDLIVTNTWDDDNNRDGIRPDGVTVQLMKNGVAEGEPVVLNNANNNTYTWSNMIRYDDKGNEIEYTLSVTPIAEVAGHTGYTQSVDKSGYIADLTATSGGYRFTVENVHIPEKVNLTVSKIWDDDNNIDGIRPASITAKLSDGTMVVLNEGNNWKYTVAGRYKYENGKEIKYTWKELSVPDGYTLTVGGSDYDTTLTNKHKSVEDIVVVSTWDDDDNRDGIRPDGITVQLMKNGVAEGDPVELNEANSNTYTWPNMIRFDDKGDEIDYTLSVTPIAEVAGHTGYTQTVDKSSYTVDLTATAGGYKFTVKNVHIPEKVDLTVSKVWNDNNNSDGIRPASIEVELSDGTKAELNEGNNWKFIAVGKYKYENGKEIKYTWKEVNVPDGYTLTVSESGYDTTLTNSHKSVEDIVVTSTWDDDNNRDGIRPDGVTVQLMKNGVAEGDPVVLNDANNNTYTWSNMMRYDDNGKEVEYTLSVTPIADVEGHTGYTQTVDKSGYIAGLTATAGGYKFTVKNIHEPEKVTRTVIAVWIDNDNIDGIRPGKLDVELSQGSTVTINAGNSWTYIFTGLYKYENGKLKDYSWIAPAVPEGYSFSQTVKDTVTTFVYVHERVNNQPTPVAKTNTPLPSTGEGIATRTYLAAIFLIVSCGMGVMALRGFRKKEE